MEQLNEKRLPNKSSKGRREYNGTKEPKVRKIGKRIVEAIRLNRIEHMNDLVITVDQRLEALVHFFIRKHSLVCCEQWIQMFISVRQQLREQKKTQSYRVQLLIILTVILQRAVDHVQLVQLRKGENRLAQQQLVASCEVASKKSLLFSLNILDNLLRSLRNRSLHRLLQRDEERLDAFRVLERQFRDVREEGAVGGRNCLQIELGNPGID
jgi:hypothetical protein